MAAKKGLLISSDSHVIEEPDLWVKRLPAAFRDRAPIYERKVGGSFQAHDGGHDPKARVKEMAVDGVSGEVLYATFALGQFGIKDAALQEACFRVFNDWLIDYCSYSPDRLFGVACISVFNIDNAIKEMERCKKAGMRGVEIWQAPPEDLPFAGKHYERFWAAAQDLDLPVSLHILTGAPYEKVPPVVTAVDAFNDRVNNRLHHAAQAVSDLIGSGVFERYPGAKVVLVENEASWLPFMITQWDKYVRRHKYDLKMLPSEYCHRQVFATFFNDPPLRGVLKAWTCDNFMWSNDFPHPNSTWPNSHEVIERDIGDLPASDRAKLMYENVIKLYSLPTIQALAAE